MNVETCAFFFMQYCTYHYFFDILFFYVILHIGMCEIYHIDYHITTNSNILYDNENDNICLKQIVFICFYHKNKCLYVLLLLL